MNEEKNALQSTTIISSLVAAGATILNLFGIAEVAPQEQEAIVEGLTALVALGGTIGAIYGRVKAKHKLTF